MSLKCNKVRQQACPAALALLAILVFGFVPAGAETPPPKKRVAALIAKWFPHSHPDVILGRILKTDTMDGKGRPYDLELAAVYVDLPGERTLCESLAKTYGFKIAATPEEALTLGTGKLAVDGVILTTEWADYPKSDTGQIKYPHRRLFESIAKVCKQSGRACPVFVDKHLADNWADAKWIYDQAQALAIPLMAGSSVPGTWRQPPADVQADKPLREIVGVSYHTLDGYGFHCLELIQALAEKRKGGETGIRAVRCLTNNAVWEAAGTLYDPELLAAALARAGDPAGAKPLRDRVPAPVLFHFEYADGLRANLFTLNGAILHWAAAWKYDDGSSAATLAPTQESGAFMNFAFQTRGIERMILTGHPAWPAERTLMTSGALDAALISLRDGGREVETPYLKFSYPAFWTWQPPP